MSASSKQEVYMLLLLY